MKLIDDLGDLIDNFMDEFGELGFTDKARALMSAKDNISKSKAKIPKKVKSSTTKLELRVSQFKSLAEAAKDFDLSDMKKRIMESGATDVKSCYEAIYGPIEPTEVDHRDAKKELKKKAKRQAKKAGKHDHHH